MNLLFLLLVQSALALPPRAMLENPTAAAPIPQALRKDYDKAWSRFITGRQDKKVMEDLDKLFRKRGVFDAGLILQGYVALYRGDDAGAQDKFRRARAVNGANRIATYYLAELAFARAEYSDAAGLYGDLLSMRAADPQIETKRQKALLLAMDSLIQAAARAEAGNRLSEAEDKYRQALKIAPNEPALHLHLAELLARQNRNDEAAVERNAAENLNVRLADAGSVKKTAGPDAEADDLETIGRWGGEIAVFHQIRSADVVDREQLALLIARYFPQVLDAPQTPRIMTDIEDSAARSEIQAVTGAGIMEPLPNHAFQPAAPVNRGELAKALASAGQLIGVSTEGTAAVSVSDVDSSNALYADVDFVLRSGIMTLQDSGAFDVSGPASGALAVSAVERLLHAFQQTQH